MADDESPARGQKAKLMETARARFKQWLDADDKQAKRERDDLRFYAGEQWPDDIRASRAGQNASGGLPPVPARPCLTINKTREPVRQVLNQERQADLGIELVPADDFAGLTGPIDESEIELREGLVRRIQRESQAADARSWAFARATIAGRGYYGVMTRYTPGKSADQEIYVQRFYNQAAVGLDPSHEQPDGSDAEWGFIGTWMPWDQYKAEFPSHARQRNLVTDAEESDFKTWADEQPDWFKSDGDQRAVYVTDYYYTERESRALAMFPDGRAEWIEDLPPDTPAESYESRTVVEKSVKWCKLDGANPDPLDKTDWPGQYIPIIKVVGEELQPYDNERRYEGMVRPSRDSQQGYNAMISKWVETVALSPIPPYFVAEGQIEGYEPWYQAANTRTLPYLPYKTRDLDGQPVGPPTSVPREAPIAAIAASVQMFDEGIQSTTGMHDPSLGKVDPSLKSGRAIKQIVDQAQRGTSNYLDNLTRSIRYEAMVENDLLYPIYGRPGRIARILNGQGEAQAVMLHEPFVMQGTKPVKAGPEAPGAKTYTLTEHAQFNVAIKVTRQFDTRREQEVALLGEIIAGEPTLMTWFGDLFFKHQDGPGHLEMADRAKVMLDPKILAMLDAKKQGMEIPPQVQQQLAESKQLIEMAQQEIQKLQQQIQTDEVKAKRDIEKATLDNDTKLKIAEMDDHTKRAIELARIAAETTKREDEQRHERETREDEQRHEMALKSGDAGQEQHMAELSQEQAQEAMEQGFAADAMLADQGHQQGLEAQAAEPQQGEV